MADVYTLAEHLKLETDPTRAAVLACLLERVKVSEILPFQTIGRLSTKFTRWSELPSPTFRNANEPFGSSTGRNEQGEEAVYIAGGNVDIERVFTEDQGVIVDPRQDQLDKFMAAMSYMINDKFINGDQATSPKEFNGLKVRIGNLPSRQTVSASAAAGGLDVRASDPNMFTFFDKLNEAMDKVEDGNPDVILCNTNTRLGIESALRRLKLYATTRDLFDREVSTYRGARIYDMGPTLAGALDDSVQIITQGETPAGGGANQATSIYCVRFARDGGEYLHGIDLHPLRTIDIGLLENGAQKRTNIEWPMGLIITNPRSATRLKDVAWAT